MKVGDRVKIVKETVFTGDFYGVIVRMPLDKPSNPPRLNDSKVLVDIGPGPNNTRKLQPVMLEHLEGA